MTILISNIAGPTAYGPTGPTGPEGPSTVSTGAFTISSSTPFIVYSNTISANYTISSGYNALTGGPITINSGVAVTISTGSVWTVV